MIKHILVPSNGLEANLLEDAFKLASPFSAHVDVLHVGWEATREMHFYDNRLSPEMLDTMISQAQREADKIASAARKDIRAGHDRRFGPCHHQTHELGLCDG